MSTPGPLVSIAIPAYKARDLSKTISSALSQRYDRIEIIIVNDCSPEDIDSIVGSFSDSRLSYYRNKYNVGKKDLVEQWNRCLSYAKGEFFCLLCDDDIISPNFVQTLIELSNIYENVDVFRARVATVDSSENIIDYFPCYPEWSSGKEYTYHLLKGYQRQTISEFMIRTTALRSLGGYQSLPLAWGSDKLTVIMACYKNGIVSSSNVNVYFHDYGQNLSANNDMVLKEKLNAAFLFKQKLSDYLATKGVTSSSCLPVEVYYSNYKNWLLSTASVKTIICMLFNRKQYPTVSRFVAYQHIIIKIAEEIVDFNRKIKKTIKNGIPFVFRSDCKL